MWKLFHNVYVYENTVLYTLGLFISYRSVNPKEKRCTGELTHSLCFFIYQWKAMWDHSEKAVIYKLESPHHKTIQLTPWSWTYLQPPALWENKCLLFKPPSLLFCYHSQSRLIQPVNRACFIFVHTSFCKITFLILLIYVST